MSNKALNLESVNINDILSLTYDQLSLFANSEDFWNILDTTFGTEYNHNLAATVRSLWQIGDFSQIPSIEILNSEILGNANGAYASSTNTIYLSDNFLKSATPESIKSVVLEEIGHFIDAQINSVDSLGDEGAIFSALVQGKNLSSQDLASLKTEDDTATLTLGGKTLEIEKNDEETSLLLDGVNDYVQIPHNDNLNINTAFTVELWFKAKPDQFSGDQLFALVDKSHGIAPAFSGWTIQGLATNGILGFSVGNGTEHITALTTTNILDDQWHHVAGVLNGSTLSIYLDGILSQSVPFTGTPVNNNGVLDFGCVTFNTVRYFNGNIDEVRMWNQARTQEEIQANMNHTLNGTETGLIGYWQFNEATGNIVSDLAGNDNNGTVYGATWTEGFFGNSVLSLSQPEYSIRENGATSVQVTVIRTGGFNGEVSAIDLLRKYQTIANFVFKESS